MNLLRRYKYVPTTDLTIDTFRKYQYSILYYIIENGIKYISKQGNGFLDDYQIIIEQIPDYWGVYNSKYLEITVNVKTSTSPQQFFKLIIPELIDGYMYYLNGNYYVPTIYIIDYPIIFKNNSGKLTGTFNSITFQMSKTFCMAIFTGININMNDFIQLFLFDDPEGMELYNQFNSKYSSSYKLDYKILDQEQLEIKFKNIFKLNNDIYGIRQYVEDLFFDNYTTSLYQYCYGLETVNLSSIIKIFLLKKNNFECPSFIDLTNKRLIFLETLLEPLFNKMAHAANTAKRGYREYNLKINQLQSLKHFLKSPVKNDSSKSVKGLSGNYLYDTVNLYSGLIKMKISMISPNIKTPPSEVKDLHITHKGIICPLTISNQKPGTTVSILPGTKLDEFGRFLL